MSMLDNDETECVHRVFRMLRLLGVRTNFWRWNDGMDTVIEVPVGGVYDFVERWGA